MKDDEFTCPYMSAEDARAASLGACTICPIPKEDCTNDLYKQSKDDYAGRYGAFPVGADGKPLRPGDHVEKAEGCAYYDNGIIHSVSFMGSGDKIVYVHWAISGDEFEENPSELVHIDPHGTKHFNNIVRSLFDKGSFEVDDFQKVLSEAASLGKQGLWDEEQKNALREICTHSSFFNNELKVR